MTVGDSMHIDPVTGGRKAVKLARFDLIPCRPLWLLAEHYGRGSLKYDDNNWRKGYKWSASYAAMMRHANQFWGGENTDPGLQSLHTVAVAWHAFTLTEYLLCGLGTDDRPSILVP